MGIITQEELKSAVEGIKKIQEEIRQFTPIVREDLKHLNDSEFMQKVCNNYIEYKIGQAKDGDFLYQCSFHNRRYFDTKNSLGKTPKEKPGIDVNVAGLAKFIIDCPYAGEFMCKLRDFVFENKSDSKKDVKNL